MIKKNKAVSLNSIEKECFTKLYDYCFDNPRQIKQFCKNYKSKSSFDKNLLYNFEFIYNYLNEFFIDTHSVLSFADFLLNYIQIISINVTCKKNKAFSIFESINSKGKPLDIIDKIKTYIFSKIDEKDYDTYLDIWGDLIIKTNDELYDYLYNYIKAYISFYRQNINIDNFKKLAESNLLGYFNKNEVGDALKALLNDMQNKVKYYNMLSNNNDAYQLIDSSEFKFYYKIFTELNYKHPKALFLRCFEEFDNNKIQKSEVINIVRETVKLMFEFLTISGKDSKDIITMFATIMNSIYYKRTIDEKIIINIIANEIISKGITPEKIKIELSNMDAYDTNKKLSAALLALYDSIEENKDNPDNFRISYDRAYTLFNAHGTTLSLDHLLVQTPDKNSNFKYYKNENGFLVLKDGQDFTQYFHNIIDGMEYEQFKKIALHKLGNLRLYYRDDNAAKQNDELKLNSTETLTNYTNIAERGTEIIDKLVNKCLPMPHYNSEIQVSAEFPKMKQLIEYGLINIGTAIYLTFAPEDSIATLINDKYVNYNGKKMTLNAWGQEVSGWKSINIYNYTAIVGENETLHQKRVNYILNKNSDESD